MANLKSIWQKMWRFQKSDESAEEIINMLKSLDDKNYHGNEFPLLQTYDDFKVLYVGKKVQDILGYTQAEYIELNKYFTRGGTALQSNYLKDLTK